MTNGMVLDGICDAFLEVAFGREWIDLDLEGRRLVMADFVDASESEELSVSEYWRRIGRGNLEAYADCLKAGATRRVTR